MEKEKEKEADGIPWESRQTIDMKLYNVPKKTAQDWKRWCDEQGLRFNQGMVLALQIIKGSEERQEYGRLAEENRMIIEELLEKVDGFVKQDSKKSGKSTDKKNEDDEKGKPKGFGSNIKKEREGSE